MSHASAPPGRLSLPSPRTDVRPRRRWLRIAEPVSFYGVCCSIPSVLETGRGRCELRRGWVIEVGQRHGPSPAAGPSWGGPRAVGFPVHRRRPVRRDAEPVDHARGPPDSRTSTSPGSSSSPSSRRAASPVGGGWRGSRSRVPTTRSLTVAPTEPGWRLCLVICRPVKDRVVGTRERDPRQPPQTGEAARLEDGEDDEPGLVDVRESGPRPEHGQQARRHDVQADAGDSQPDCATTPPTDQALAGDAHARPACPRIPIRAEARPPARPVSRTARN